MFSCGYHEVAMNVSSGEVCILRADLLYDAGASLNPAVDLGQIQKGGTLVALRVSTNRFFSSPPLGYLSPLSGWLLAFVSPEGSKCRFKMYVITKADHGITVDVE